MDHSTRKRRRGSDGWDKHRPTIERLYLEKDLTLKEVIDEMKKSPYNFDKTEQAYKKRLGQWNISKNVPASVINEMLSIADRRRRDEGKETDFYWHENIVDHGKIRRTQKRLMKGANTSTMSTASLKHMRYSTPPPSLASHRTSGTPKASSTVSEKTLDGSLDIIGTWESLRDVAATLEMTPDVAQPVDLEPILAAQERLLGGYLFFFGKDNTAYLSHCLSLCYISVYAGTCANYITPFKRAVSRVKELEWPCSNVNSLLKLSIAFLELEATCTESLELLDFAMDHPAVNIEDWVVPVRLRIIERAQEVRSWSTAVRHLLLTIDYMRTHPDSWEAAHLESLTERLRVHDWDKGRTEMLSLKSTKVNDIENYFLLTKLLLHAGVTSQALTMISSATNVRLEDFREHTAVINGILSIDDQLNKVPEWTNGLSSTISERIYQRAEQILEPHDRDYAEAHKALARLRSRHNNEGSEEKRSFLTVQVPAPLRPREDLHSTRLDQNLSEHGLLLRQSRGVAAEVPLSPGHTAMMDISQEVATSIGFDISHERGRRPHRAQALNGQQRSPISVRTSEPPGQQHSPLGTVSPAILSRDVSPSQPTFASHSPDDSRRASQISMTSVINERLRSANEARSSAPIGSNDISSVPNSPFRPNSAYASEWVAHSDAQFTRRSSAPGLDWSTGRGVNFTNPNPFASHSRGSEFPTWPDYSISFPGGDIPMNDMGLLQNYPTYSVSTEGSGSPTNIQHSTRPLEGQKESRPSKTHAETSWPSQPCQPAISSI
ncbi:MAG: hypothetical protein MMC23_007970 [Stictis urceolatum]|nr:hypothetical protein [Stictis urceolata]